MVLVFKVELGIFCGPIGRSQKRPALYPITDLLYPVTWTTLEKVNRAGPVLIQKNFL